MEKSTQEADAQSTARRTGVAQTGNGRPDREMQAVLDMLQSLGPKPIETLDAKEARKQPTPADAVEKLLDERGESTDPEDVGDVDDRTIDGPAGDIKVRIYKPASAAADALLPVVLFVHGGGWVIADLDVYDASPRALANAAHAIVVSTHYRQGPEHRFPAAHEDVYAAYKWVIAAAHDFGGDASRVAVVGESAGGNLATVVCLNARDEGLPLPVHQVLVYPIADSDTNTESYREQAQAKPLNAAMMRWFFDNYLRGPEDGQTPAISLNRAADLSGLPPATIINAELDPLRSDGERLAERLRAAGVQTEQRTYPGVTHEFFGMGAVLPKAKDAQQFAAAALRRAFDR
jgi:acetyl esterase/lipase